MASCVTVNTSLARRDGISQMGPNIFQLNITMSQLAKSIANYAIDCFNVKEFAIMNPLGDYGNAMTASFTQAVENRGGKIIAYQNYLEGKPDYKTEFDLLRSVRYKQENRKKNIAYGADNLDAINSKSRKAYLQDSVAKYPAIFMPATNPVDDPQDGYSSLLRQMCVHIGLKYPKLYSYTPST